MSAQQSRAEVRSARLPATQRRIQLANVAARNFHELGYHRVSLAALATEVGLTAPAVYRHFRNKQALLAAAIASGLDLVEDALLRTVGGSLEDLVGAVTDAGLTRPDLWVLLQRESRFLEPDLRVEISSQFARIIESFVRRLRKERTDLSDADAHFLVAAATAVMSSPAELSSSPGRAEYRRELVSSALACLRFDLAAHPEGVDAVAVAAGAADSRREEIVAAATDLFFTRGYDAVSLDDIGGVLGMAGPSLLHYFQGKQQILQAPFDRATEEMHRWHREFVQADPPLTLRGQVSAYVAFALAHRTLVGVYVSDVIHLPDDALDSTRVALRELMSDWVTTLSAAEDSLTTPAARARVAAALVVINDLVRLGHYHERPGVASEITGLALAVLEHDATGPRRASGVR
ncbi:TetR/AcrR family transcriptional regulator [Gordonia polyisoprenivorans]|uniref:TetR/AcrR family transcriptional regulator n=1 Tax=Gordonia polyisoprenivorans TaxID=84595 RepID=UPI001AD6D85B|nr:TetR/AcrR family transcriptional regulator [Gordonia polyisoprenivorans]QTI69003.1 TetR/AcrR family transcriptional regulator [Gordonia polyisoprenivorans]